MTKFTSGTDVTNMKRTYRTAIAGDFPEELTLGMVKEADLKYGENPNQPAAVYRLGRTSRLAELTNIGLAKTGKGGISATNFMDVTRAMQILGYFERPSVAVMKHLVPSGFATEYGGATLAETYRKARDADVRSAFGSIVVTNRPVDVETAEAIMESYVEGVAAPEYAEGAMGVFERKKDIRVMSYDNLDRLPRFVGDDTEGLFDMKVLPTGRVIAQKPYLTSIRGPEDLVLNPMINERFVERAPSPRELEDLLTAWYVNFGVRSNGIVFVRNGVTVAVGSGQQERVGAVEQAIIKAYQKAMDREGIKHDSLRGITGPGLDIRIVSPLRGAVCSSDAFFPFRDSIDTMASVGVSAVIQPGGSIRDEEVIQAVNDHEMAMAFTLERCFGHF